jgi:FkbM family methyltransferase
MLPILPDSMANRLPFLGRVCVEGPNDLRLRFHTYGPHGKDRIAIKLARRGFWGYEGETIRVFLPLITWAKCVVDVGANTGLFALLAAKANPHCRVFAFEPVPFIHDMLNANVQLNGLTNLHTVRSAVSDLTGETPFFITHTSVGIPTDSSSCAGFRSDVQEIRLPTITLDEFMHQQDIPGLDVLKIDAEATEAKVIRGGIDTLRRHRPFVIGEILENVDHGFVEQTFKELTYQFYHIGPEGLERRPNLTGSLAVDQRNYLFVPAEKASAMDGLSRRRRK